MEQGSGRGQWMVPKQLARLRPSGVVANDDLPQSAIERLVLESIQKPSQPERPVVRGDYDRELGRHVHDLRGPPSGT
jgi:hypothetical protein